MPLILLTQYIDINGFYIIFIVINILTFAAIFSGFYTSQFRKFYVNIQVAREQVDKPVDVAVWLVKRQKKVG